MKSLQEIEAILGGPFERLFETPGLPGFGMRGELTYLYDGDMGFERPRWFANFVASVDGVVAFPDGGQSGRTISGNSLPDRFLMGMLRACAQAVLIGAGTFRAAPSAFRRPEAVFPAAEELFSSIRTGLGLGSAPLLAVVTASGEIDISSPSLENSLVVTTGAGRRRIGSMVPPGVRLIVCESSPIRTEELVEKLRAEGLELVLVEGGPALLGQLVLDRSLHELFLTVSPRLYGRVTGDGRKSLVQGIDLSGAEMELTSVRKHGSCLFLRYTFFR